MERSVSEDVSNYAPLQIPESNAPIEYSDDQLRAIEGMSDFVKSGRVGVYRVGGYAGTGKTTTIAYVVDRFPGSAVCAFTGKAASVLRSKGMDGNTIHSTIYHWDEKKEEFRLMSPWEMNAEYFVIDEGSMVSRSLWEDLQTFGKPIIVVGDPGQLEPVGDDPRLMHDPDIILEKIHRQAEGSAIIEFANHVRRGGIFKMGCKREVLIGGPELFEDSLEWADQLLCGFNRTRVGVNSKVRMLRGKDGVIDDGERLICLRNNAAIGVFNGMMMTVARRVHADRDWIECDVVTDDGKEMRHRMYLHHFGLEKPLPFEKLRRLDDDLVICDYGYCCSVHKFQGSEADKVAVLDQQCDVWDPVRWRYTAITRSAKELRYCMSQ